MPDTEGDVVMTGMLAAVLSAVAPAANAAPLPERPIVRVVVQRETLAIDGPMIADIVRNARDIWRPYADITFEIDGDRLLASRSLRLVITDRTSTLSGGASLGWIEFVDGGPSNVITVSAAAATALLRASRWSGLPKTVQRTFLVRAMARAIAHELGHYLLASRDHASRGLMRGQLTPDDIMQPRRSSYRLDPGEVRRLQRGVLLARRDGALRSDSEFGIQN
jgi:hypothetical protein